tara:strand:+ start:278 stop:739 length:462 start_codon:yes stop_codon:yes gene_type:complete
MDEDYDKNFGFLIHDVARLLRVAYDRRMKPLGLTRSQWWVINHLFFHPGISQTNLAKLLDVGRATLGRLLDRLEAKQWIYRQPDDKDSRIKRVYLSDTVRPTLQTMRHEAKQTVDGALSSLSEKEQSQLFSMLYRMKTELSLANEGQSEKEEE